METTNTLPSFSRNAEGMWQFNKWMYQEVQGYVHGRTLLSGAGLESLFVPLLADKIPIHVSFSSSVIRKEFQDKHDGDPLVRMVHAIDFYSNNFSQEYLNLAGAFNTIILSGSIAYNKTIDRLVTQNCISLLCDGGNLIVAMPSLTAAFGDMEVSLEEWKRLDRKPIKQFMDGFEVLKIRYCSLKQTELYVIAIVSKLSFVEKYP